MGRRQLVIVLVVVVVFAGIVAGKAMTGSTDPATSAQSPATTNEANSTSGDSKQRNAAGDYEAALKSGKPIYLMFHSLTCQPCVEIAAVAEKVIPDYAEKIVFVDAITGDDPSVQQLAAKFPFQYIPQSFFLNPDGTTADSFTGAMSEGDMRARLDALLATQ